MSSGGPNVRLVLLRGAAVALLVVVAALVGSSTPRADAVESLGSRTRPAQQLGRALPLGRLVLAATEAPGLTPKAARAETAKRVLGTALRPRQLPRFAAQKTQAAHFGRGSTELWSIAFIMKSANAARAAARAIASGSTRIRLGDAGYALGGRRAVVVWHHGHVLGAIVFTSANPSPIDRRVARDFGRLADVRMSRALENTAWQHALSTVGPKGRLSRKVALDLFALAYGPLPGTKRPPGPSGGVPDATFAGRLLLAYWSTLTPAQQAEAQRLLGVTGVSISKRLHTPFGLERPLQRAILGDPNFTPSLKFQEFADSFKSAYEAQLQRQLKLTIVAGTSSSADWADAQAIDSEGRWTNFPTLCRIRVGPKGQAAPPSAARLMIAHEVFHCFQNEILTPSEVQRLLVTGRAWVIEGIANWAAESVFPVSWPIAKEVTSLGPYFADCRGYLFSRVYSSSGFFGHYEDSVGNFWPQVIDVLTAPDSPTAYERAGGNIVEFLQTWASSVMVEPLFGLAWTSFNPVNPAPGAGCVPTPITGDALVSSEGLTVSPYKIEGAPPSRPLLNIRVPRGYPRLSDSVLETTELGNAWFWVGERDQRPECPADTGGVPPPAPKLRLPAAFALTGGGAAARGTVSFVSLEDFCKHKQPLPPVDCVGGRRTNAMGAGPCGPGRHPVPGGPPGGPGRQGEKPPDPIQCTPNGCGFSAADPHLRPFGGNWYDFQATGEFTLLRSTSGELEVQVRQEPWPGSKFVAMNTAVAMRVAGDRVAIYKGQPLVVRVNGRPVLLRRADVRLPKGGVLRPLRRGQLDVVWPDGTIVRVYPPSAVAVDLIVSLAPKWKGKVTGLLGDNDGNRANDFRTRSGRILDPAVIRDRGAHAYRLRYRVYGDSWRVTPKSSLFDYAPGQSTRTFTNRRFPALIATAETLPAPVKRNAERVCRRMGLAQKPILDACILDVGQTRDYGFSTALALAQLGAKAPKGASKPPSPPPPPPAQGSGLRATITFQGRTLTITGGPTDEGCRIDRPGVAFSAGIGAFDRDDNRPSLRVSVVNGKRDGRYTTGTFVEIEWKFGTVWLITNSGESPTVTLAGNRTRGTFKGTTGPPRVDAPFSGSFRCR